MDRVRLPGTDIEVSALCLGVAEIGVRQTEIEAHHLLDYWVQNGGNGIDTARVYSDWIPGCAWPFMEARFSTFLRSDLITVCGATR